LGKQSIEILEMTTSAPGHHHRDNYFPLDGDLTAGPLLLPGFPGIFETS
jgi:hypothetical protein